MGLSDYDKKVLEQLERDLLEADDSLSRKMATPKPINSAAKLIAGALIGLIGMSLIVFAAVAQLVIFGAVGFAVALFGILIASANLVGRGQQPAKQKATRGSFFENRWENRRNG